MTRPFQFLHLEDRPEDAVLLRETLAREYLPCQVTWVDRREAFLAALQAAWVYDLVFADYAMPDLDGAEALSLARAARPDLPVIVVSGAMGEERAVECLRQGATDYVLKTNLARLAPVTRRALEEAQGNRSRREAEAASRRMASLLRTALESTTEGVLVADLAGRVSAYNRKFLTVCGIPDYVMAPMALDRVLQFLADRFQGPRAFFDEVGAANPQPIRTTVRLAGDGGERVIEESSRPHVLGRQTVGRVYCFRDVTAWEQKTERLERRIAALEEELLLARRNRSGP